MFALVTTILLAAQGASAATFSEADWQPLVDAQEYAKARPVCEAALKSKSTSEQVEALKCLANVEAGPTAGMRVDGDKKYGG